MPASPALIALDWGTSSLRAFLLGADGAVLERRAGPFGILNLPAGGFPEAFAESVGAWRARYGALPAIASGMVGSRQGWREVPYLRCPVGLEALAAGLACLAAPLGITLHLVPGILRDAPAAAPDVMRGEETQIFGGLAERAPSRLLVLPGTHSKWAVVEGERIAWFATFMTGELYALLSKHSILAKLMDGERPDGEAFAWGAAAARERAPASGGLLHKLFSARTLALFERLAPEGVAAYLSGLLIGALAARPGATAREALVIGEPALTALYLEAMAAEGLRGRAGPADAVARGLWRVARAAGLVAPAR
jgi:2-dehydro-3-deoxygalactonokinase